MWQKLIVKKESTEAGLSLELKLFLLYRHFSKSKFYNLVNEQYVIMSEESYNSLAKVLHVKFLFRIKTVNR